MPGTNDYQVSGFTNKRRASNSRSSMITAVQIQVLQDDYYFDGNGVWYESGEQADDDTTTEMRITIEPPIVGKVFRVITNQDQQVEGSSGRLTFDLLATMVLKD